jgi:quercetin dioxygenase-like cupin family protein
MSEAESTIQHEDDRVRVNRLNFATTGDETGVHTHELDYIVVPVTGGTLTVATEDGATRELVQVAGISYRGTAGTHHNVISASSEPIVFVEIELKQG